MLMLFALQRESVIDTLILLHYAWHSTQLVYESVCPEAWHATVQYTTIMPVSTLLTFKQCM